MKSSQKRAWILESACCKCKFDEMRLAEEQIDCVRETIGASQPFGVVMDRGRISHYRGTDIGI
ncbi:MAG: hypothetical protein Q4F11_08700 [Eubacteriales bacterium]|nr:hypothetical protein [Eubacteriales bacterium]